MCFVALQYKLCVGGHGRIYFFSCKTFPPKSEKSKISDTCRDEYSIPTIAYLDWLRYKSHIIRRCQAQERVSIGMQVEFCPAHLRHPRKTMLPPAPRLPSSVGRRAPFASPGNTFTMASGENDPDPGLFANVRSMWQFPATYKLLSILCVPLTIPAPTASQLEHAVHAPSDHVQLLADLHGRLLGLTAGNSAAKRWLQTTARFVRSHPDDFAPIKALQQNEKPLPADSTNNNSYNNDGNGDLNEGGDVISDHGNSDHDEDLFNFPLNINSYCNHLSPSVRLLVLHTVAELVVADHEHLLISGSLNDFSPDDLRCEPFAKDAVQNQYWYFDDSERVYREPKYVLNEDDGTSTSKTKPKQNKNSTSTTQSKSKSKQKADLEKHAAPHPKPASSESKPKSKVKSKSKSQLKSSRSQRRKSLTRSALKAETDKLVEDIFGPDSLSESEDSLGALGQPASLPLHLAAALEENSDYISKRYGNQSNPSLFNNTDKEHTNGQSSKRNGTTSVLTSSQSQSTLQLSKSKKNKTATSQPASTKNESKGPNSDPPNDVSRRTSGRVRRPPERHGASPPLSPSTSSRAAKRPRASTEPAAKPKFSDISLRQCNGWETLSVGSEALLSVINRFKDDTGNEGTTVLTSERPLVRILREQVVPLIEEDETRAGREQERVRREQGRKEKLEIIIATQKRSSTRLEAINKRRDEETRRQMEDIERDVELRFKSQLHEKSVVENIARCEKEQSCDIRVARRFFGLPDGIERDDQSTNKNVRKQKEVRRPEPRISIQQPSQPETIAVRRSSRTRQQSGRLQNLLESQTAEAKKEVEDLNTVNSTISNHWPSHVAKGDAVNESGRPHSTIEPSDLDNDIVMSDEHSKQTEEVLEKEMEKLHSEGRFTSACMEEDISADFTWSICNVDKLPRRVLHKFFFVSRQKFSEVSLEVCGDEPSPLSSASSTADSGFDNMSSDGKDEVIVVGLGLVIPPADSPPIVKRVEIGRIHNWKITYGRDPKLWIRSDKAWYELRSPADEYQEMFVRGMKRKFELCARIGILGETMRQNNLGYDSVIELLGMTYFEMDGNDEEDILREKRFIVQQIEDRIGRKTILQSEFYKKLASKVRAEDRKLAAKMQRKEEAMVTVVVKSDKETSNSKVEPLLEEMNGVPASGWRSSGRLGSSVNKRRPVPSVVTSIISGLLRAATKSKTAVRKRKRDAASNVVNGALPTGKRVKVADGVVVSSYADSKVD